MSYFDYELRLLLEGLESPRLRALLRRFVREAEFHRTEHLRLVTRESILEEEVTELYAEVWRLQRKAGAAWKTLDENTVDLSDYCKRRGGEEGERREVPAVAEGQGGGVGNLPERVTGRDTVADTRNGTRVRDQLPRGHKKA